MNNLPPDIRLLILIGVGLVIGLVISFFAFRRRSNGSFKAILTGLITIAGVVFYLIKSGKKTPDEKLIDYVEEEINKNEDQVKDSKKEQERIEKTIDSTKEQIKKEEKDTAKLEKAKLELKPKPGKKYTTHEAAKKLRNL